MAAALGAFGITVYCLVDVKSLENYNNGIVIPVKATQESRNVFSVHSVLHF